MSEVRRYPLRPEGFEEPLFPTRESRLAVAEHLLRASWLSRASSLPRVGEPVGLRRVRGGVEVVRSRARGRRCQPRPDRRRVIEIIDRWREVRGWWAEGGGVDRVVFRVLLSGQGPSGGVVADLARERGVSGGWLLTGVAD